MMQSIHKADPYRMDKMMRRAISRAEAGRWNGIGDPAGVRSISGKRLLDAAFAQTPEVTTIATDDLRRATERKRSATRRAKLKEVK